MMMMMMMMMLMLMMMMMMGPPPANPELLNPWTRGFMDSWTLFME